MEVYFCLNLGVETWSFLGGGVGVPVHFCDVMNGMDAVWGDWVGRLLGELEGRVGVILDKHSLE